MAWVYLDDQFPDHPKVARAGGDAAWLFVCGLAYCKRYETEGRIPKAQVTKLTDRRQPTKLADKLVDVGLWENDGDHYLVHDYHEWNKPQESRSAAGRKAAQARWAKERSKPQSDANAHADASESHSGRSTNGDASTCPPPRPHPSVVTSSSSEPVSRPPAAEEEPPEPTPPTPIGHAATLDATWQRLAQHDLARRLERTDLEPIRDQRRYLATAADQRRTAHEHQALTELAQRPHLTATQLAEICDPACGPDDGGLARQTAAWQADQDQRAAEDAAHDQRQAEAARLDEHIAALPDDQRSELRARAEADIPTVGGRRPEAAVRAAMRQLVEQDVR